MLGEAAASSMTEQLFKDVLTRALTDLYGVVGGAVPFTLLHLEGGEGIVRVARRSGGLRLLPAVPCTAPAPQSPPSIPVALHTHPASYWS